MSFPDGSAATPPAPEDDLAPGEDRSVSIPPALLGLSVAGLTRRRVGWIAAAVVSAWIVIVFGRQVGEASAASSRADALAAENEVAAAEIAALRIELDLVGRPEFVDLAARAERLGTGRERPFTLAADPPPLADDAPGSALAALGAAQQHRPPVEVWLSLLFGPAD
ncbi:MAG TPA: hypothetical protein VJZ72_08145 [Candidatus Limnocylindrales bacterium]|nr:hypothetical protein [Candidatus Limnocylindrales bacterium]